MVAFPAPVPGASLLLAFRPINRTVLVVGANGLAASRAFAVLEAGAKVVVASSIDLESACDELQWRVHQGHVKWKRLVSDTEADFVSLLNSLGDVSLVCVTDTLLGNPLSRSAESAHIIHLQCRSRNIPVNITDMPGLCDFTFPSSHRFASRSRNQEACTPLQIAITSNGKGCRLAGRIRRELVSKVDPATGDAVENVARLRALANLDAHHMDVPENVIGGITINAPVPQLSARTVEDPNERVLRRMRWVNQVSEYWPMDRLANLDEAGMADLLETTGLDGVPSPSDATVAAPTSRVHSEPPDSRSSDASRHGLASPARTSQGQILLVGSGPGHPSMLTVAARQALAELGTLILSDKLVPPEVLALIPPHIPLYIAKKFPGNSEGAQNELMEMAVEAALKGEIVVRLKQGDPMVYGRGGEEVLYFRQHGFESIVIPGVSSALAGPSFAGIPPTQRGVAETLTICTGVGRKGKEVQLPGYERARTLTILMGVARLPQIIAALINPASTRRTGGVYPPYLPIAIVERASSPDQRLIASTLDGIVGALERVGEQRPPAMMVVGWAVLALDGEGDLAVLGDAERLSAEELEAVDKGRVTRWLGDAGSLVRDGLRLEWQQFH